MILANGVKNFGTHLSMDLHKIEKVAELGRGCFIILGREGTVCSHVCGDACETERETNGEPCTLHLVCGFSVDSGTNIY